MCPVVLCCAAARNGPNSLPRKIPEYTAFDKATGLHGHHRWATAAAKKQWCVRDRNHLPCYFLWGSTHLGVA